MKWITRERPKIDRIACPWLIKRFVDKEAEFIYMPKEKVIEEAKKINAIAYDMRELNIPIMVKNVRLIISLKSME